MSKTKQQKFMLNYYLMVIFLFVLLLAIKLSGVFAAIFSFIAFIVSNPAIKFSQNRHRWLSLLFISILIIVFFPDLHELKEIENLK